MINDSHRYLQSLDLNEEREVESLSSFTKEL